jgi:hypothetical protein
VVARLTKAQRNQQVTWRTARTYPSTRRRAGITEIAPAIILSGLWSAELTYRTGRKAAFVIREELARLFIWEERHRRLAARLLSRSG